MKRRAASSPDDGPGKAQAVAAGSSSTSASSGAAGQAGGAGAETQAAAAAATAETAADAEALAAYRRQHAWKCFLDGTLGPGGGGIDTAKFILSYVGFKQRGDAMRALATRATVADVQAQFIRSWVMGGHDKSRYGDEFPAANALLESPALVPGAESLGPPRCALLRFAVPGGVPVQCKDDRGMVLAAVKQWAFANALATQPRHGPL